MPVRRSTAAYAAIRTEGGLLPPDLLERILRQDVSLGGFAPKDYGLQLDIRLMAQMSEAWQAIQTHYASFRRSMQLIERDNVPGTSETRAWVQSVLRELGFRELRFVAAAETVGNRSFLISHRAGDAENAPPIHIVSFRQGLDERSGRTGGGEQRSPHALMQGYLNASNHLWGIVTNGLTFRLLRENRQIDRVLRVDFDLVGMLDSESFAEFQLFWLVLHRSRFVQPGEHRETAWLERWSQTAASEGTRALSALRTGVETAIEAFGQGLLSHPGNRHLRDQLATGALTVDDYYSELLRLVYRLLFLLVAEERRLLFPTGTDPQVIARYRKHYSIERLRVEAVRRRHRETHYDDLWRGLLVTFDAMRYPEESGALGLKPLGGGLFGAGSCPHVADDAAHGTPNGGDRSAGRPMLSNAALLDAIQALSEVTRDGITRHINYRDLDAEELGSVYEGLLEHRPALAPQLNGDYRFGFGESTSRKETGSYYTPRSLVQALLDSALDPVIDSALERAKTPEAKQRALLELNVCDPACGSGHFLLGAARRIGRRLAEVRAGVDREPEPGDLRRATAEAIRHCVYGVDKNPLAVDLCKVALWIESHEPGGPIGFLDHHIRRGDSLVGVFDLDVLQSGIPDGAYKPVTGDDKSVASDLKKLNKAERSKSTVLSEGHKAPMYNASLFVAGEREDNLKALGHRLREIDALPERTAADVQAKAAAYKAVHARQDWRDLSTACDLWTWAFFTPLTKEARQLVPTSDTVRQMVETGNVRGDLVGVAGGAAAEIGFFHWRLAFPDVFSWHDRAGGFDAVLGNPPWERVKLQEKEFFAERELEIANAPNKAARDRLIRALPATNPALAEAFEEAKREAENASLFMRGSERFPLTGRGDVNLYSVFAEHFRNLIAPSGRAGVIVPTGIATDLTNRHFFGYLVSNEILATLYDIQNEEKFFPSVDHRVRFSLVSFTGGKSVSPAVFVTFARYLEDIDQEERRVVLTPRDFRLFTPNTLTLPTFRFVRDAVIARSVYERVPILRKNHNGDIHDPWGITFQTMFHMSGDARFFLQCEHDEESLTVGIGPSPYDHEALPLYEAKMVHQYDHRFGTYEGQTEAQARQGKLPELSEVDHRDPSQTVQPRYWVSAKEVRKRRRSTNEWLLVFRDITNPVVFRTAIFAVTPVAGVGHPLPIVYLSHPPRLHTAFLANTNTLVFDYLARQKVGGSHLTYFILDQLPVLAPEAYTEDLLAMIVPRVLELTFTSYDMAPFACDLGYGGPPFTWDEDRRAQLRAELDGIFAHLYGISRDDFAYILGTFSIVARKDIEKFGEYRTKRLCLEAYDHFAPETLRALELEVREIEGELRHVIVRALDNDPERLPGDLRAALIEERAKHRAGEVDGQAPPLRELLEASYLPQLSKIVRSDAAWPVLADRFGSRSEFKRHFGHLTTFRNPLAHGRSVDEDVRRDGESAIAWFRERLGATMLPHR